VDKIPLKRKIDEEDNFLNALAEAYRLQESIIGTTELSIVSTNTKGVITSFNKAAETLTGYVAADMIGKSTPIVFHDPVEIIERAHELSLELGRDISPNFEVFTTKTKDNKVAERREWTYIRKDGKRVPVSLSITSLWDDNDALLGFAEIASDITESKLAAKKITESEAHLQALLNSIDDVALEVSKDGVFTNVWTKKENLLLTSKDEYIGKRLQDLLPDGILQLHRDAIAKVLKSRQSESIEYLIPNQDRWSSCKISYINDDKVLLLIRNITKRKKSEILLAQSESKFRTLAENIPGAIYLCRNDATYSMLYLNDRVEEITGYETSEFLSGKVSFTTLYHPDDRDDIFAKVDRALETGTKFHLKYRIRHRSGEWRWVDEVGIGVYADNKLQLIEGFISDITFQKKAEEELHKIADENYRLFNNAVTLNVIAGFDGFFKRLNPTWVELLGWTDDELTSRTFFEFVHPDDIDATEAAIAKMKDGSNLLSYENRYQCKDGTYRWLLWGSTSDAKNDLIYASAIDITERKKSEEELLRSKQNLEAIALNLREQNRQLDEFAHIISHNLRSPVGNIKALIDLLGPTSSVDEYQQIFEKLKNVAKNLGETMNELMATIKAKKKTDVERTELLFKDTFDKVVQSLEGELIHTEATVTSDFSAATSILYSKAYLESIFQNLLSNAIKYRSPSRKPIINVATRTENRSIVLTVSDNGLGMDLEKIGDSLFGLHQTFHDHQDASGVGLFLIKTQIEAMGGTIEAISEIDKGTTFVIRF
jgi:PAS domain S-box-containing protein